MITAQKFEQVARSSGWDIPADEYRDQLSECYRRAFYRWMRSEVGIAGVDTDGHRTRFISTWYNHSRFWFKTEEDELAFVLKYGK